MPQFADLLPILAVASLAAVACGMVVALVGALKVGCDDGRGDRMLAVELALRNLILASGGKRLPVGAFAVEDLGDGRISARLYGGREVFPSVRDADACLVAELMRSVGAAASTVELGDGDQARSRAIRHCLNAVEGYFKIDADGGRMAPRLAATA